FDEVIAYRRLFDSVGFLKILYHRAVVARRKPAHHLVPNRVLHRRAALKHLIASQALLAILLGPQPASLDRHLLAVHNAIAGFFSPTLYLPIRLRLVS